MTRKGLLWVFSRKSRDYFSVMILVLVQGCPLKFRTRETILILIFDLIVPYTGEFSPLLFLRTVYLILNVLWILNFYLIFFIFYLPSLPNWMVILIFINRYIHGYIVIFESNNKKYVQYVCVYYAGMHIQYVCMLFVIMFMHESNSTSTWDS